MKTACPDCRAPLIERVFVASAVPPTFVEAYRCGAVVAWGAVDGDPKLRRCPAPAVGSEPCVLRSHGTGTPGISYEVHMDELRRLDALIQQLGAERDQFRADDSLTRGRA